MEMLAYSDEWLQQQRDAGLLCTEFSEEALARSQGR
jgi:hypothetical protein